MTALEGEVWMPIPGMDRMIRVDIPLSWEDADLGALLPGYESMMYPDWKRPTIPVVAIATAMTWNVGAV